MRVLTTSVQVRFSDVDIARHVHNAAYLQYFETGRMAYLAKFIPKEHDWSKEGLILARNEIDYLSPIHLHDRIQVNTWCARIGEKSFDLAYEVQSEDEARTLYAKGKSVMVAYNYKDTGTIPLPSSWLQALKEALETNR